VKKLSAEARPPWVPAMDWFNVTPMDFYDGREYLAAIFEATINDGVVDTATMVYRGSSFFVSEEGDAVTAAHVLRTPSDLAPGRRLVAMVAEDGQPAARLITAAAVFEAFDVALFKVTPAKSKCFEVSDEEVPAGTDVSVIGFPSHRLYGKGLEMRFLKGYVTAVMPRLELNFPVPAGMSGAPVFVNAKIVGFATGRVRSEEIDEQTEELVRVDDAKEELRITKTASIVYYGLANTFRMMRFARHPALDGLSLLEFIAAAKARGA
jgi:hypothetical protein